MPKSPPAYFAYWLAGFIEAEGSFSLRRGGNVVTFSIAQAYDKYLIEAILVFYGQTHLSVQTVTMPSGKPLYSTSIGSVEGLTCVVRHCAPLLQGYKHYQMVQFVYRSKRLTPLRSLIDPSLAGLQPPPSLNKVAATVSLRAGLT